MIIWLASYPKSGNTWLRSLLSAYFFSKDGSFNFDLLRNIQQFPSSKYFEKYNDLFLKPEDTSKYWLQELNRINSDKKIKFLKTHNAYCKVNNNSFADEKNTLGAIYIIRDPRKVLSSLAHHYQINNQKAFELMINENKVLVEKKNNRFLGYNPLLSWPLHLKTWSECIKFPVLTIRYEDLENETYVTFKKIYNFIQKISKLKKNFNKEKAKKIIQTCSFDNFQKLEKSNGFFEAITKKNSDKKLKFFNLGVKNNYQKLLNEKLINQMNVSFSEELKKYNYE